MLDAKLDLLDSIMKNKIIADIENEKNNKII